MGGRGRPGAAGGGEEGASTKEGAAGNNLISSHPSGPFSTRRKKRTRTFPEGETVINFSVYILEFSVDFFVVKYWSRNSNEVNVNFRFTYQSLIFHSLIEVSETH